MKLSEVDYIDLVVFGKQRGIQWVLWAVRVRRY